MNKVVSTLVVTLLVLIFVGGCIMQPRPIEPNSFLNQEDLNQETQELSECNEVPMKYNVGDGTIFFKCGLVWIGSEEYQTGLDWKEDCSLTIRNMETDESGLWKVIFYLKTQDGTKQLEQSRYIYPGESYAFDAQFSIKDPYRNCENGAAGCPKELKDYPEIRYEIISPTKRVCEK